MSKTLIAGVLLIVVGGGLTVWNWVLKPGTAQTVPQAQIQQPAPAAQQGALFW